jgi:hypothetical protein
MGKAMAMTVLLIAFLAYQPFSAAAQTPGKNVAKIKAQVEQTALGEAQASSGNVFLVNARSDLPIFSRDFNKKNFKTELQRRLGLQLKFSLAIQLLALLIGFLALAVIGVRRRLRSV